MVGREVLQNPGVLVVSQPTWGVDAGAAAAIHQALITLAANGAAVLVISQDLDELLMLTDRLAVINVGVLSDPLATASASVEEIGLLMGGAARHAASPSTATEASPMSLRIEPRRSVSWQMLYAHAAAGGGAHRR